MGTYPHITRLNLIIDALNIMRLKKGDLIDKLKDSGFNISTKTLERDFDEIRNLGYDLTYFRSQGYSIENSVTHEIDILNKVKDQMSSSNLHQFITDENAIQSPPSLSINILPIILKSISKRTSISFIYEKYDSNDKSKRTVAPLVLKEYYGQWHLLAFEYASNMCKVFGCDRIKSLKEKEQFDGEIIDENKKEIAEFKAKLGASMPLSEWTDSKPYFPNLSIEIITLKVSKKYLPYLKSNPVHYSQRISNEKENGFTKVYFKLIPNIDLIKFIISQLGEIKIIEPVNLKKFISIRYKNLITDITYTTI